MQKLSKLNSTCKVMEIHYKKLHRNQKSDLEEIMNGNSYLNRDSGPRANIKESIEKMSEMMLDSSSLNRFKFDYQASPINKSQYRANQENTSSFEDHQPNVYNKTIISSIMFLREHEPSPPSQKNYISVENSKQQSLKQLMIRKKGHLRMASDFNHSKPDTKSKGKFKNIII